MLELRAYRTGFVPALAALVVLAFSIDGIPEPLEPAPVTIEFDAERAAAEARALVRVAPGREPGSEGAAAAADYVRNAFEDVASGTVAEQELDASLDGEDVQLRNILLTLPGADDRAIVVLAGRSSQAEPGTATSAAATGLLIELAAGFGVSAREQTLVLASIDGAAAAADGVGELLDAIPPETAIEAVIVISQPGAAELAEPHLVTSSDARERPSLTLIRTASDALASRAGVGAGLDGPLAQIARLALPAASGTQAALLADGVDAVAVSAAGEVPLPAERAEALAPESLERFGATVLALVGALDAGGGAPEAPSSYVRIGGNTVPGWTVAMLALVLLVPPVVPLAMALARAPRQGTSRATWAWAIEWAAVAVAPVFLLLVLALVGLVPSPEVPYDPGRFGVGPFEVLAMLVLAGAAVGAWWALGLRRVPAGPDPVTLGAAAGAVCIAACLLAWLANPFLALVLVPLAHVAMVHGARPSRTVLAFPVAAAALIPLAAVVAHVAGALDWGAATPWQLVVLVASGSLGPTSAAAIALALVGVLGVVQSCVRGAPQAVSRGRP